MAQSIKSYSENSWNCYVILGSQSWPGIYSCTLCRFTRGPRYLEWNGTRVEMGCTNLYVPTDQLVYVAPSMILHYIDAHSYLPPMKFCNAVMLCPVMRSIEYLKAVRQTGIAIGNR